MMDKVPNKKILSGNFCNVLISLLDFMSLNMYWIDCPKTLVGNYCFMLRNIPEDTR